MVEGGVDMAEAINYDAEQLYEKLIKEKQEQDKNEKGNNTQSQSSNGQTGNHGGGNSTSDTKIQNKDDNQSSGNDKQNKDENKQDVGHDTHSMWEDAVKEYKEKQSKDKGKESLFDKLFNKDKKEKKEEKNDIEKKQQETEQLGEKEVFKKNTAEKIKQLQELKKSLSEQAMGPGSSTNRDRRNITDIGRAKPLIDWRYVLKEAIKYDVDWSYKNATIEDGVVTANLEEQPMPETEIVLDTSGSIDEILLKNFLRECKNILQHSRLKFCIETSDF